MTDIILIILIGFLFGFYLGLQLADAQEINWYQASEKGKSVLELCCDNGKCQKLLHNNKDIESKSIEDWVLMFDKNCDIIRNEQAR